MYDLGQIADAALVSVLEVPKHVHVRVRGFASERHLVPPCVALLVEASFPADAGHDEAGVLVEHLAAVMAQRALARKRRFEVVDGGAEILQGAAHPIGCSKQCGEVVHDASPCGVAIGSR
jgi:hypothetical protein